ncbi:MAG: translation initiation factor IF-2 subunit gamma [Candidatus Pacearchaeota archaeon]|nr:MAG: translation initiation factor IF-2 subunit gamma [Candidatus Pacearchaeota archaeon]
MVDNKNKQPELNIGLVGHIDHGKTTLLYQLTGVWSDKHSEELKRGITIKLGYADSLIRKCEKCGKFTTKPVCECGGKVSEIRYVSFVDAPGHEMLMATMLGGAAIIDAALLVIAANEPFPQPQTKEHLLALEAKGISQVIIVQNKLDLITKEEAKKQYDAVKKFIKGTIAENATIIPICAQQGINIGALLEAVTKLKIPEHDTISKPLFLIARSFDVNKPGTKPKDLSGGILGGSLKKGKLKIGDIIEIKPGLAKKKHDKTEYYAIKTKITGLRAGVNKLSEALPSGSLAIQTSLDPLLAKADSLAGCVAGLEGTLPELAYKIKIKINLFKEIVGAKAKEAIKIEQLKTNENLLLSVNTTTTVGLITSIHNNTTEIALKIPIVSFPGDRIGIARNYQGHWRLIGWGEIQ